MNDASTPAGWYPDPTNDGRQRWWNGTAWTESFADAQDGATAGVTTAVASGTRAAVTTPRMRWPWIVGGLAAVAAVGVIVTFVLIGVLRGGGSGASASPEQAVRAYMEAWWDADCASYEAVTTQRLRDAFEIDYDLPYSCEAFASTAGELYGATSEEGFEVSALETQSSQARLEGRESFVRAGTPEWTDWTLHLVLDGDSWLVDSEEIVDSSGD